MTEKENFLRAITGKEPAWVPRNGGTFRNRFTIDPPAVVAVPVGFLVKDRTKEGGKSIWGVEFITTKDTGGESMPNPSKRLFDDVTLWRDHIKAPSLDGIDWEKMAAKDLSKVDRSQTAVRIGVGNFFMHLVGMMGFEGALVSLMTDPDEVYALFDYMADFQEAVLKKVLKYYKPDVYFITDDTASAFSPFFSVETYRTLLKPFQKRLCDLARNEGLPIHMHNCGICQDLIPDWIDDLGVCSWEPAQLMNDLLGIKEKYAHKIMLVGCWDSAGPVGWPNASEELIRSEVRKCIDTYAPGGGFCFWASTYGAPDDPEFVKRAEWITDEYNKYGRTFYQRQG